MRMILSLVCAIALVGFVNADDKGKEVKLEGKMCCAKCELNKSDKCATVFVAKDGGHTALLHLLTLPDGRKIDGPPIDIR